MEGPPLKVIAENLSNFIGKRVVLAYGSAKIRYDGIEGQKVEDIFTVGKNLFIQFAEVSLRIHFLMFGSYRVNEVRKEPEPRLYMNLENDTLSFYNCPVSLLRNLDIEKLYDKQVDIMSDHWNIDRVFDLASRMKNEYVCDVLLDQSVFAGVGNIIKNEALYKSRVHPLSVVGKIPSDKLREIATNAREFSFLFYKLKKEGKGWDHILRVYGKRECPDGEGKVTKKWTGKRKRVSYFCASSQTLYA